MNSSHLSLEEILWVHKGEIEKYGGVHGVRDWGLLESALARPQSGYYDGVIEEAAAFLESMVINHPFNDGNKRVAFRSTDIFLDRNGYETNFDEVEADSFIRDISVNRENRFQRIIDWLEKNTSIA